MAKHNSLKISAKDLHYMAFEGGGGKGVTFLGVVQAFEEDIMVNGKPILPIKKGVENQIKGISGSSAGAITALMLAMGYSSQDILNELGRYDFDQFFDDPKPGFYRVVDITADPTTYAGQHRPEFVKERLNNIKFWLGMASTLKDSAIIMAFLKMFWDTKGVLVGEEEGVKKLAETFKKIRKKLPLPILKKLLNKKYLPAYINNLLFEKGLFPGFEVRRYFQELIFERFKGDHARHQGRSRSADTDEKYIAEVANWVTFWNFEVLTGIDLKVVGANVTTKRSLLFSKDSTPNFPVSEAVGISMNLPFLFKPVFIEHAAPNDMKNVYRGWWVDGGLLNNLPLHAFDDPTTGDFNRHIMAFRVTPEMKGVNIIGRSNEVMEQDVDIDGIEE